MKVDDKHFYYGAAVMQIAEDKHFTAINPLRMNGVTSQNGFLINTNIVVYPKYAGKPKGTHKEYQFTFKEENIAELEEIVKHHPHLFIALVCVHDREVCCLTYAQFRDLYQRRRKSAGHDEEQLVVIATLPKGKQFRVYVNAAGTRGKFLGKQLLVARSDFPAALFA